MSLLWTLDSSLPATLFADTSKTVAITDGTGAAAVVSAGGTISTDALQSTSGSRPTYRANYSGSGYPALEFDGTADHLAIAHSADWNLSVIDVFAVLTLTGALAYRGIVAKWSSTAWNDGWGLGTNGTSFVAGAPSFAAYTAAYTGGARILIHTHFHAAESGGQFGDHYGGSAAGAGPQNNSASVLIGRADPSGAFYMSGAINEICLFGGGETSQVIIDTKQSLRAKWGLASVAAGGVSQLINGGLIRGQVL